MSWIEIKNELYSMAEEMTIANGYNYDWSTSRRVDIYHKPTATFIIELPDNAPFETNVSDLGGINSFQYRLQREVLMVARIKSDPDAVKMSTIVEANDDALELALDDIRQKFCGNITTNLCPLGVNKVEYNTAFKRELDSHTVYYPSDLVVAMDVQYRINHC